MLEVDGAYCGWQDEMGYCTLNQGVVLMSTARIPETEQASTRGPEAARSACQYRHIRTVRAIRQKGVPSVVGSTSQYCGYFLCPKVRFRNRSTT